ncbi:TetR/AcrR family transcriptional regulator [Silvimonas sp. JCM 19000]
MEKTPRSSAKRDASLSRERIIEAAIDLLDRHGESGLTFRALAEQLATGAGALYWHIANKSDLLTAACDGVIARTLYAAPVGADPAAHIRAVASGLFDAIDAHPWVGSALAQAPGQLPGVRILERLGQQVSAMGVPPAAHWVVTCTLLNYIFGVGGQNAANAQQAEAQQHDRTHFLDAMATTWSQLDAVEFPFTRSVAAQLRNHDDRADFLSGLELILAGIRSMAAQPAHKD